MPNKPYRYAVWMLALLLSAGVQASACVKSVRWVNTPPYAFKDAQGTIRGLHVDLAQEALGRLDCEARLVEMPWPRAMVELKLGRLDLLPGAANTPDRETFAYFSRPTNGARNVLFIPRTVERKYTLTKLADIIGTDFRLAVQRGSTYGNAYEALLTKPDFNARLTYVYSQESALRMMAAGRAEGYISDELSGLYAIDRLGLGRILQRSKIVTSKDADHIAFSKASNDTAFVKRFDQALGNMVTDGTYKQILERYLSCPVNVEKLGCQ